MKAWKRQFWWPENININITKSIQYINITKWRKHSKRARRRWAKSQNCSKFIMLTLNIFPILNNLKLLIWCVSFAWCIEANITAQKIKFSIKEFFSKCDQIYSSLRIRLHLLKKSLMNFIFVQKCTELHKCTEVL